MGKKQFLKLELSTILIRLFSFVLYHLMSFKTICFSFSFAFPVQSKFLLKLYAYLLVTHIETLKFEPSVYSGSATHTKQIFKQKVVFGHCAISFLSSKMVTYSIQ